MTGLRRTDMSLMTRAPVASPGQNGGTWTGIVCPRPRSPAQRHSVIATVQSTFSKPVEVLVVGLPVETNDDENPKNMLRKAIKEYTVEVTRDRRSLLVTPNVFRHLSIAIENRTVSIDNLKFQTYDRYQKLIGDIEYGIETGLFNSRGQVDPICLDKSNNPGDISDDLTLSLHPYNDEEVPSYDWYRDFN
jgi:hypothetical protein